MKPKKPTGDEIIESLKTSKGLWRNDAVLRYESELEAEQERETDLPLQRGEYAAIRQRFTEIQEEVVRWLWYPYLPLGKLSLLGGDPGMGKTWVSLAIARAHSQGIWPFIVPGKESVHTPGHTLYFGTEDGPGDTLKPRLRQLGANLDQISYVSGKRDFKETVSRFLLSDGATLEREIAETRARLCIFDPLQAFLPQGVKMNEMETIRPLVTLLKDVAERTQCAILLLGHLNKSKQETLAYKFLGSVDWYAAARSAMMILRDTEDPRLRHFYQIKNSLAPIPDGQSFRLEGDPQPFAWTGMTARSAEDMARGGEEQGKKTNLAMSFLQDALGGGEKPSTEVENAAATLGISRRALFQAKADLKVVSRKASFSGTWFWKLPE